ncbi:MULTISPECIES: hypothetical protein [unclassified Paenibacillus]|uniref:hypothetical protein n=1 Tax=unclassified Paenibacillus TaxID=185978 RepID=UPI00038F2B3F|nr:MULTISPECIES: hypothetical protein [unclassified Paenibacillus]KKC49551.1 hypothetical protein VE23_24960 [Paenibacillus sp. D9]CDN41705.1 hypothetical protein BN871_AJ_00570 [Paenibacillus sp. P22]
MGKQIEKVPVCFNVLDPDQAAMLDWVKTRKNRSGYLKRLIQRDMDAAGGLVTVTIPAKGAVLRPAKASEPVEPRDLAYSAAAAFV